MGRRTEPCGTPHVTEALFDTWPLMEINCFFVKEVRFKPFIYNTMHVIMFTLCSEISCSTALKAFCSGVVVITNAPQHHSTKLEPTFCAGSNPAHDVMEIWDDEDLWQWSQLEIRLNAFHQSTTPQKQYIIIYHHQQQKYHNQYFFYLSFS